MRQRPDLEFESKSRNQKNPSSSGSPIRVMEVVILVVVIGAMIFFGSKIVAIEKLTERVGVVATSVDDVAAAIRSTNQRVDSLIAAKEATDNDRKQAVEEYRQLREELARTLDALERYQGASNVAR
ncbi:MAG: hypothetical protein ACRER2_10515 [Methylococcales bacterium]